MTPCEAQLLGRTPVEQQRPPHSKNPRPQAAEEGLG